MDIVKDLIKKPSSFSNICFKYFFFLVFALQIIVGFGDQQIK